MAPCEVLLLLAPARFVEIPVIPMLFREIAAVSTIFVAVPRMVVLAILVVVAFFLRGSGLRDDRTNQCGAQH